MGLKPDTPLLQHSNSFTRVSFDYGNPRREFEKSLEEQHD